MIPAPHPRKRITRRLWAFVVGDIEVAENIEFTNYPPVEWITDAGGSAAKATYALESTMRAAADAGSAVKQIQDRAATLLGTVLALFPLSMAVTILVTPGKHPTWARWASFGFFVFADLFLTAAAAMAFLAGGLQRAGGLNPANYRPTTPTTVAGLKVIEADAWYAAARLAFDAGHRKAQDLFAARRFVIMALLISVLASPFIFASRSELKTTTPHPRPSSTPVVK